MRWLKAVTVPEVPDDRQERHAAIVNSRTTLAEARNKQPDVDRMAESIQKHIAPNHLAERLYEAYGRRPEVEK